MKKIIHQITSMLSATLSRQRNILRAKFVATIPIPVFSTAVYGLKLKPVLVRNYTVVFFIAFASQYASAQCTGCTQTVTSNSSAITVNSGSVVCLTYSGTFSQSITFNGGTLCIGPNTTVSAAITVNSGCTLNVYGKVTGAYSTNGGTTTVYSGGSLAPSSSSFNGGSLVINSGGSANVGTTSISSSVTITSSGSFTASSLTDNGANVTLSGTNSITGSLTVNGGNFSMSGPSVIGGSFAANGGTTTFSGGISISGSVTNNAAINLSGSLSIGSSYTSNTGATITATSAGSSLSASSVTGYGTITGGGYSFAVSPTPSNCSSCIVNGAYVVGVPTQQPTSLSLSISGNAIRGSFTSPSSSITGYIVLRYIGTSAPASSPTDNTSYTVGSSIGTCTVAAIVPGGSGTLSFTDNVTASSTNCGQHVYYRIFSYNGIGSAIQYDLTSPLTGNIAVPAASASITASGPTTFCTPGSVTLTASAGTSFVWSNAATTQAITVTTGATYTVTVTSAMGCTATASQVVTANTVATITPYLSINQGAWQSVNTGTVCTGGMIEFGPQPMSGTWTWTGPSGFHSYERDTLIQIATISEGGTYTATYVDGNGCSATEAFSITVNTVNATVNSPTICSGNTATITATGGGSYNWSTGATTASISEASAGTYTVTVTGSNTCTAVVTSTLTVNTTPSAAIAVTPVCTGASSTLTASGGGSYLWSTGATTAAISSTTNSNYTVTVTGSGNCSATATATAVIYASPSLSLTSNTPVCVGSTISVTATPSGSSSYTYSWSGPSSYSGSSSSVSVANAISADSGLYYVTVTDNHNCTVSGSADVYVNPNCKDSTTVGANGGSSANAPCTQILRFDHYNAVVASQPGGQNHTWVLENGNILTMNIACTAGGFTSVAAPTWSGAAFGQSGYTGLAGKTVLYTNNSGYSKLVFSNIQMKDSLGNAINNFTLIGIDGESTDNSERDTLISNGTSWYNYDTITPPNIGSVPSETGIGTSTLVWTGTGPANARARLVSTNNPTYFTFSTVAGGLQGFAMGISNPIVAPTAVTICSGNGFTATPTNLPSGTTYTWSAPVVSPAGSLTGATAQTTPVSVVGQSLVNTSSSVATATYTVVPSNNCSGLGYTVTVTVNPAPSATISTNAPICAGGNLSVTATSSGTSTLSYSWTGPAGFTSSSNAFAINNAATTASGSYMLTMTGTNGCITRDTTVISVANCLSVSGNIFDDGNGSGLVDSTGAMTDYGQALYTIIADTNNVVISTSTVASNGAFTLSNVLPNKSGMTVRVSTTDPSIGSPAPVAAWPANWVGTLGQYGVNNADGTGVYNNTSELIPVKTGTTNITAMYLGFDRLEAPTTQAFVIPKPALNTVIGLNSASGLGNITWSDPEDGANKGSFVVENITGMHNNVLFYDSNNNNMVDPGEIITGYRVISSFNDQRLKMKFTAVGTTSASFTFGYIDDAGKTNPSVSTYSVSWTGGALPVTLEYFTAAKDGTDASLLQWSTATEINNAYFDVERSADAQVWSSLGQVQGAGTTDQQQFYSFTDNTPLNGTNYYRLKQVDADGNFTYTNIAEVSFDGAATGANAMSVYPNPLSTSTPLTIEMTNPNQSISLVTIVNSIGQIVHNDVSPEGSSILISGLSLPAGVYVISVYCGDVKPLTSLLVIR